MKPDPSVFEFNCCAKDAISSDNKTTYSAVDVPDYCNRTHLTML